MEGVEDEEKRNAVLYTQLAHAAMNAMADKYDIPELKKLVVQKFQKKDPAEWCHGVSEVLREVYMTTPAGDELRDFIAMVCATIGEDFDKDPGYSTCLKELPEAHVDILQHKLRNCKDSYRMLQKKRQEENDLATQNSRHLSRIANYAQIETKKIIDFLKEVFSCEDGAGPKCRMCTEKFGLKWEEVVNDDEEALDRHDPFMICLSCTKCGCDNEIPYDL